MGGLRKWLLIEVVEEEVAERNPEKLVRKRVLKWKNRLWEGRQGGNRASRMKGGKEQDEWWTVEERRRATEESGLDKRACRVDGALRRPTVSVRPKEEASKKSAKMAKQAT